MAPTKASKSFFFFSNYSVIPSWCILSFSLRGAYIFIHSSTLLHGLKGVTRLAAGPLLEP